MELEDEESYAAAALFTLALHSSQHDRGNETELAWGCVWPEQQHGLPLMLLLLRVAVCPSATKATQAIAAAAMSGRSTCPSLSLSAGSRLTWRWTPLCWSTWMLLGWRRTGWVPLMMGAGTPPSACLPADLTILRACLGRPAGLPACHQVL